MTFIKGQNVELRVLEDCDAEVFTKAVNQGLTTQHLFTGSIPMRTKDYAKRWQQEREAGDILFGVWTSGRFIGTCGLHQNYPVYRKWESRFLIFDADSVGKGLGKEIVSLLTSYAFRRLNAHKVWLGVSEFNTRALKCYTDCGYVHEGRLIDDVFYDGKYHAVIRMAAFEGSWKSLSTVAAQ